MPQGSETILLVEDEAAVRAIARHVLQSCGYNVLEVSNGDEALRRCEQHQGPIQLIVSDVVMPVMDGRLLMEHLAKLRPQTRVLYMSGYTDDVVIRHGISQVGMAFLQKPFTPYALANKVREVLDQ
jgi:CheY-like chemotaxis protein